MLGILEELGKLAVSTVEIVAAPVEIGLSMVNAPLEQAADTLTELAKDIKEDMK